MDTTVEDVEMGARPLGAHKMTLGNAQEGGGGCGAWSYTVSIIQGKKVFSHTSLIAVKRYVL